MHLEFDHNYLKAELYQLVREDARIFDFIQAGSLDGIWFWDLEKMDQEWLSPKFWETLGYDPTEMKHLSSEWQNIIFQEDLATAVDNVQKHLADPTYPYDQIVRYKHKNGSTVWVRCRGIAIRDENGKPIRLLGAHTDISMLKKTELSLLESQNTYKELLNGLPDIVYMHSKDDGGIFYSDYVETILGYSPQYLYEHPFLLKDAIHPNFREAVETSLKELDKGINFAIEYQIKTSTGKWIWLNDRSISKKSENGQTVVFGIATDITERKNAELELTKMKMHLGTLIESTQDMIWSVDSEQFGLISFNSALRKYFKEGLNLDIRQGMTPYELVEPDTALKWVEIYNRALKEGPYEMEYPVASMNRQMHLSINPLVVSGEVYGISVFGRDITERKRNEAIIRDNEQKYRQVVENIPVGIFSFDTSGQINFVNNKILEITGHPSKESLMAVNALTNQNLIKWGFADFHKKSIETGMILKIESEYGMINGKNMCTLVQDAPIKNDAGEVTGIISIVEDFSERKTIQNELVQAKEKAEAANAAKSQFLANMSHEIRTPLNGIMGMVQLALMSDLSNEQKECLSTALASANLLSKVVTDVLDYTRIESGKLYIEKEQLLLETIIEEVVSLFEIPLKSRDLRIQVQVEDRLKVYLKGDSLKLRQILSNLVGNAVKFSNYGVIEIRAIAVEETAREMKLKIQIADTGIGIPPEKMEFIFNRFEQADNSHTRKYGGSGLGLSICKGLVELMHGEIGVESEEGKGSTFSFTCVLEKGIVEEQDEKKEIRETATETCDEMNLKVLIVEDDETNRTVMDAFAKKMGCRTVLCENGQKAVDLCAESTFDLIIMDIQMPVMNGYDATALIRKIDEKQHIHTPIIAMTAYALSGDKEKCLQAGMDDYLAKPILRNVFNTMIAQWTKR